MNWKKNTILFLTSQAVSLFGSMLVQYAITWHITLTTQSGTMMTIAIICGFLPVFLLSPFAGVWADRYDRKRLIILADALIALATLTLALLFLAGYRAIWPLFAASAVRALGSGIQAPAIGAFLPQIVPAEKLTRVNAANSSIQSLVTLVSPMLSGALLTVATMETIFFIDVITAAVAIAILALFLPVPAHAGALTRQKTGYLEADRYRPADAGPGPVHLGQPGIDRGRRTGGDGLPTPASRKAAQRRPIYSLARLAQVRPRVQRGCSP